MREPRVLRRAKACRLPPSTELQTPSKMLSEFKRVARACDE
ncbi:MAG: hypothetical protein AVDCRST_MAG93-9486 [uncultured Chloroflexia bacterium]|uniref:Uncharacterized protein n=1 Tax=uncultured Chloroflexia bacterium TaxID=1672391 RepID=A0A6J4NFR6_9CHLR|nr:MAG: hypothetical protein AVDCRST_MAG93-9486 [uncultured Chloroflexia bacterium]